MATLAVCLNAKLDPIIPRRKCKFCAIAFVPKVKANGKTQFCCDEHRYAYRNDANRAARTIRRRAWRHYERYRSVALDGFGRLSGPINRTASSPTVFK